MKYVKRLYSLINNNENNKMVFWNVIGAFLVKGGGLLVSLLAMPLYIDYFDDQVILGLWFTMLSVLSWVLTFDLGIGNGLRNHLVPLFVKQDKKEIKHYISSAYIVIAILVTVITILSMYVFKFINWNVVFNVPESLIDGKTLLVSVTFVFSGIMLNFLLKLINSILYAIQKSAVNNFISLLSSILLVAFLLINPSGDLSTKLILISIMYILTANLPLLIATIIIFSKNLRYARPNLKFYKKKYAKDILSLGGVFFWVQIMYMIITTTNDFLITWLSGPSYVVEYQVYYKLFTLVGTIFTLALTPIWSAVTKAISEDNIDWVKRLYRILQKITLVAVLFEFLMILFLQLGIDIWLGENSFNVDYFYAFTFAVYGSIFIWNGVLSSIANGLGELKTQTICYTIGALVKFPLAFIFVDYFNSWIGVVLANIIAMGLYSVIQPLVFKKQ